MTIKPLKSTTSYCGGTREREVLHNAIFDGEMYICTISTPYRQKLNKITEAVIKSLENETIPNSGGAQQD